MKKGFTLIELLVVIAIIGILARFCCRVARPAKRPAELRQQPETDGHHLQDVCQREQRREVASVYGGPGRDRLRRRDSR